MTGRAAAGSRQRPARRTWGHWHWQALMPDPPRTPCARSCRMHAARSACARMTRVACIRCHQVALAVSTLYFCRAAMRMRSCTCTPSITSLVKPLHSMRTTGLYATSRYGKYAGPWKVAAQLACTRRRARGENPIAICMSFVIKNLTMPSLFVTTRSNQRFEIYEVPWVRPFQMGNSICGYDSYKNGV